MLKQLSIQNYALIKELNISPAETLNTITGETGAGKSIMLGAVGLLLGKRADTKVLLDTDSKCIIEGHFNLAAYQLKPLFDKEDLDYEDTTIIRREITPAGKSRAFVNDSPVTLDILKKLGVKLMDVHSQHETLHLGNNTFQLKFVDVVAESLELRSSIQQSYKVYRQSKLELDRLVEMKSEANKESDYNNFLLSELEEINLQKDEQESLEETVQIQEHAEEIKTKLNEGIQLLNAEEFSITQAVQQLKQALSHITKFSQSYTPLAERIESTAIELADILKELEREEEQVSYDPEEAQRAQDRLSKIYQLQTKHQVSSISELLQIQESLADKVLTGQNLDGEIEKLKKQTDKAYTEAQSLADELSAIRQKSFEQIKSELENLLAEVGMPDAAIEVKHQAVELGQTGIDQINILFSANKGIAPQELSKVASGGEFSRLMFCIKYILAQKVSLPTIIFDEIDTGVSGEIALKMGNMMKRMAKHHQVITITHLPQIAGKGDKHWFVYKDNSSDVTISMIRELSSEDRIKAIAQMIGGDNPTDTAYQNARELMQTS